MMPSEEEIARIRRLELAGGITRPEAEVLVVAARKGQPMSLPHALSRLPLTELQARWLTGQSSAGTGAGTRYMPPSSRDQLVAAILDRVS